MAATIRIIVSTSGGLDDVRRDIAGLGESASRSGGGFNALKEVATGAFRFIGEQAVVAAGKVAGFVGDSIGAAGDFEAGMNQFSAAAGDSLGAAGLDVKDFSDLFIQLGKDLPVSTKDVQDAAITLIKGGIDPLILKAGGLESSLKFAAAANMDLGEAAELSIKQLGTFIPITASAAEQTRFLAESQDLMVKAAGASTLDVDKLGAAMLGAGGQAKAMNLDYKDFVTTMGLISPSFSSAETAGTSYKNFLVRLIPTTKKATGMMVDLGLMTEDGKNKFFDATGAFVGNAKAAQLLQDSLKDLTAEQRTEALQTIFGNDAMGAAVALAGAGAEGYDAFAKKMAGANGVTAQAATVQQGYNNAVTNAKGSLEALQLVIGGALLPTLTPLVNQFSAGVGVAINLAQAILGDKEAMEGLSPSIQGVARWVDSVVAAFGYWDRGMISTRTALDVLAPGVGDFLAPTIERVLGLVDLLAPAIGVLGDFIAGNTPTVMGLVNAIDGIAEAFGLTTAQSAGVISTMQTVIGAFQGGGLASQALGGYVDALKARWEVLQGAIVNVVNGAVAVVMPAFALIQQFLAAHGTQITAVITTAWNSINAIINTTIQILGIVINAFLTGVGGWIVAHGDTIYRVMEAAWNLIASVITTTLNLIQGVVTFVLQAISGDWKGAHDTLLNTSTDFVKNLWNLFSNGMELIAAFFGTSLQGIVDLWIGNLNMLISIVGKIDWAGVGASIIGGIINGIKAGVGALKDAVSNAAQSALDAAKSALGIASPSKIMAMQVGFPMAQGMAEGMALGAPLVAQSAAYAAGAGVAGAQTYNNQRSISVTNNYASTPPASYSASLVRSLGGV